MFGRERKRKPSQGSQGPLKWTTHEGLSVMVPGKMEPQNQSPSVCVQYAMRYHRQSMGIVNRNSWRRIASVLLLGLFLNTIVQRGVLRQV